MKDPLRSKKAVTFMLNFSEEESDEDNEAEEVGAAAAQESAQKSPDKKGASPKSPEKKGKVIYVNVTDDLELPRKKAPSV